MKKERGITLIALIITVIILLILAGVAISSLGNSGLFSKSKDAVNKYTDAQKNEEAELANYLNELENQSKPPVEVPSGFIPIYTRADLEKVGSGVQGYTIQGKTYNMNNDAKYILMDDIDLIGSDWNPLPELEGELNGNYKKISNMTITDTTQLNIGLFSVLSGSINKLAMENIKIDLTTDSTNVNIGALAGVGTIEKTSSEIYITGSIYSLYGNVGGFFGQEGNIENVYNLAKVEVNDGYSGGFIGNSIMSSLLTSYNAGNIISLSAGSSGGFIGQYFWDTRLSNIYWYDATNILSSFIGTNHSPDTNGFNQAKYTEAQMKQKTSFTGFDFDNVWTIDEGNSMPKLKGFEK